MGTKMKKEVILTGLRANAQMHLGNYLGAIKPMVELQQQVKSDSNYELNMFVPDLHSFTTPIDHDTLYQNSIDNVRVFIAAGLEIEHSETYFYRQSYIPAHSEMTWILSCFTYVGELNRMTQFKEKGSETENVSAGLYNYPVLMAADILLYGAKWVPVGDDQKQHLELTRDIGQRLNNKFGNILTLPHEWEKQLEFSHRSEGVRIRSLKKPDQKMSKSVDDPAGTIMLNDEPKQAAEKIKGATTDSLGIINFDWEEQPGITNLLQILAIIKDESVEAVAEAWQGKTNYGELKDSVAEAVYAWLEDFQQKYDSTDQSQIIEKLEQDERVMADIANQTLLRVQSAVGLRN